MALVGMAGLGALGRALAIDVVGSASTHTATTVVVGGQAGLAEIGEAARFAKRAVEVPFESQLDTAVAPLDALRGEAPRLHVFVSNDWDVPNHEASTFLLQERLHASHPELRVTHYVGPYLFTDASVPFGMAEEHVAWLRRVEAAHGDEIGLHIHPYSSLVEEAGLSSTGRAPYFTSPRVGRDPGYSLNLGAAFDEAETRQLLLRSRELFLEHGLPEPTAFRAGGWTADAHTLRALADTGFRSDASAVPVELLGSWITNGEPLYPWLKRTWEGIDTGSQPYFPSKQRPNVAGDLPLLEIPDNGALADYMTTDRMTALFDQLVGQMNADGKSRVLSIGYHGVSLPNHFPRIDGALRYIDSKLASSGLGPAVYSTAREIADLFGQTPRAMN